MQMQHLFLLSTQRTHTQHIHSEQTFGEHVAGSRCSTLSATFLHVMGTVHPLGAGAGQAHVHTPMA